MDEEPVVEPALHDDEVAEPAEAAEEAEASAPLTPPELLLPSSVLGPKPVAHAVRQTPWSSAGPSPPPMPTAAGASARGLLRLPNTNIAPSQTREIVAIVEQFSGSKAFEQLYIFHWVSPFFILYLPVHPGQHLLRKKACSLPPRRIALQRAKAVSPSSSTAAGAAAVPTTAPAAKAGIAAGAYVSTAAAVAGDFPPGPSPPSPSGAPETEGSTECLAGPRPPDDPPPAAAYAAAASFYAAQAMEAAAKAAAVAGWSSKALAFNSTSRICYEPHKLYALKNCCV